jgi:hypothetical protein
MDCREIKRLIPIYSDGESEPKESQAVKDHLTGCLTCQKELEAFEQSWAMLGEIEDVQPNPGYVGRFWTRLVLERSWHERILEGVKDGLFKKRLVPAFVAACVMVTAGFFSMHNYLQVREADQMLASLSEDELAMVQDFELAENLDLIQEMDFLEDLEVIENLDALETKLLWQERKRLLS